MSAISRGFTLIELMIVVAIIAILAAIAIPAYQDYVIRSQVSEGIVLATGAKAAIWDFVGNTGRYPATNLSAGLPLDTDIAGDFVSKVDVNVGTVLVTFGGPKANVILSLAQSIQLSPITLSGSLKWRCSSTTLPGKYLPTSCRF